MPPSTGTWRLALPSRPCQRRPIRPRCPYSDTARKKDKQGCMASECPPSSTRMSRATGEGRRHGAEAHRQEDRSAAPAARSHPAERGVEAGESRRRAPEGRGDREDRRGGRGRRQARGVAHHPPRGRHETHRRSREGATDRQERPGFREGHAEVQASRGPAREARHGHEREGADRPEVRRRGGRAGGRQPPRSRQAAVGRGAEGAQGSGSGLAGRRGHLGSPQGGDGPDHGHGAGPGPWRWAPAGPG
jgi:hypothetical protein